MAVAPDGYGQVKTLVDSLRTPDTKHKVRIGIKGFVRALFPDLQLRIRRIIDKPDDVVLFVCRQLQRQAEQPGRIPRYFHRIFRNNRIGGRRGFAPCQLFAVFIHVLNRIANFGSRTVIENDFLIRFDEISEEVAKKAVLMIVSYPNNPTGAVADDRFYTELIAFAKRWDIAVLHDNAYSELVFDGKRGKSFLSYPGAKDVGVELNSFSKTYGMAGARLGVCVGNRELIAGYHRLKSNMDYGIFLPVQQAGIAALEADQNCVETTRKGDEHRRDLLVRRFGEAGWVIRPSAATMFVWARIPDAFADSEQFALSLLAECGIVVTPGTEFGAEGRRHVRIALFISDEQIEEAAQRLARSCLFSGGSDIMKPTDSGKDENK